MSGLIALGAAVAVITGIGRHFFLDAHWQRHLLFTVSLSVF